MTEAARGTGLSGTVSAFDADIGLGVIDNDAGDSFPFHCIEIADGSREIDVGARVAFSLLAKFGRYEAADIRT